MNPMILRMTHYIWLSITLIVVLTGCQMQYEPLQSSVPSLEDRTLDGAMATYWQGNIEPAIQAQCITCHSAVSPNNANLEFKRAPLSNEHDNLITLLLQYQLSNAISLESPAHNDLDATVKASIAELETYAALYWNWQTEIDTTMDFANNYFINHIEGTIIQPVCTGCHVFLGENNEPFAGTLNFYNHNNEEHSALNSVQAMTFLIDKSQADLLYSKALGNDHAGATVIRPNTVYSDYLLQHSLLVNEALQLIESPPY